jgi:hypothetical protein
MGKMNPMSGGRQQRQTGGAPSRLRVFVNYRRVRSRAERRVRARLRAEGQLRL